MPGSGYNSPNSKIARQMLEACRFIYKAYAQTCTYPLDPFFECQGDNDTRNRLMTAVHADYKTVADCAKFDPVDYDLKKPPNPHQGVVYRGGVGEEPYILFQPRAYDLAIASISGFDLEGRKVPYGNQTLGGEGRNKCAYFQGKTGMTKTWPTSGWPTWLGAVVYDPVAQAATIVFRGSRSGNGARALTGAKFKSKGSPDWVTDMNYLKSETASKFNGAEMSCGFYRAYESCIPSLQAAFRDAVGNSPLKNIYVTGHSLGGGLAQVCYLDLSCGTLANNLVFGNLLTANIQCFPISGPPILLGRASHEKISFDADVTQVYHYFSAGDAVHCSPLLATNLIPAPMRAGNWVLENFSHPFTDPVHIGVEVQLTTGSSFPEAHEPRDVWKGLHGGTVDDTFWPTFKFNLTSPSGPYVTDVTSTYVTSHLREALANSITPDMAIARTMQWRSVITKAANAEVVGRHLETFQRAVGLIAELRARSVSGGASMSVRSSINDLRRQLVAGLSTGGDATKACYWTMLQGLSASEFLSL